MLPVPDAFSVLADQDRIAILRYLHDQADTAGQVDELIEAVADGLNDTDSIQVKLIHQDLPKLESSGVIEYDHHEMTVQYTGGAMVSHLIGEIPNLEALMSADGSL